VPELFEKEEEFGLTRVEEQGRDIGEMGRAVMRTM